MLQGRCHCERVRWTLDGTPESVTACNCTICRRYGVLWAYGYIDIDIHVRGETSSYRRADGKDIEFHFCPNCGCVTHYIATTPQADGRLWTAVNTRMCEPESIAALPIDHFDGLVDWRDLPRDGRLVKDMWF